MTKNVTTSLNYALRNCDTILHPIATVVEPVRALAFSRRADGAKVVRLMQADPVLAGQVIRRANSAFYQSAHKCNTLQGALTRIGMDGLRGMRSLSDLESLSVGQWTPIQHRCWIHNMAVSLIAREIADRVRFSSPEMARLAGLVHDIGRDLIAAAMPGGIDKINAEAKNKGMTPTQVERLVLGSGHNTLGIQILAMWNFPIEILEAVENHHRTSDDEHRTHETGLWLSRILRVADLLASVSNLGTGEEIEQTPLNAMELRAVPIDPIAAEQIVNGTREALRERADMIELELPADFEQPSPASETLRNFLTPPAPVA